MNDVKAISNKKERKEWKKSITIDGYTKSLSVEELDNGGYLLCYNTYGKKTPDGEYEDTYKKFYSKTNPLEKEEPVDKTGNEELNTILDIIDAPTQLL